MEFCDPTFAGTLSVEATIKSLTGDVLSEDLCNSILQAVVRKMPPSLAPPLARSSVCNAVIGGHASGPRATRHGAGKKLLQKFSWG
jgi:hypothetical protein